MRSRLGVLALIATGVMGAAGCQQATPTGPAVLPATAPMSASPAAVNRSDPAMQVAARFELARCGWDWRRPQAAYIRAQQLFATPAFGAQLARAADPVSWRAEVLAGRQTVTCALRDVRRAVGAPPSATQAYVRVIFAASVVSARGRFETGPGTAAWRVVRTGAGWRVAGPFVGG